jgi:porphobilinogen synthase
MYPIDRPRRLRFSENLRQLTGETNIKSDKLIMPVFIDETLDKQTEIKSMPGIYSQTLDSLEEYTNNLKKIGLKSVLLFGIPKEKNSEGSQSFNKEGIIQRAIPLFLEKGILTITDLCMCEYTDHGHCGILNGNNVDNDKTIAYYAKIALSQAEAGAQIIAPSGMMDGQIKIIRNALDQNGFNHIPIMAYSAKYASTLYGPFRDAAKSTPTFGDRMSYQMNPANSKEAMREIELDIQEGADIIMVKPALYYLDVIKMASQRFNKPLAAYGVSGEYSMLVNAIRSELISSNSIEEYVLSVFRAGADMFITYFAEYIVSGKHRKI